MPSHEQHPSIEDIRQSLRHIQRTARRVLIAQRVMSVVSIAISIALFLTVVDFAMRLPSGIRMVQLLVGGSVLGVVFVRWILPALRFGPGITSIALRMERVEPAMKGMLASGLELSKQESETAVTRSLSAYVVLRATALWGQHSVPRMIRFEGFVRSSMVLGATIGVVLSLGLVQPTLSGIGVTRTLLPWLGAQWPARTDIESLMDVSVYPSDRAIPFQAGLVRSHLEHASTDVYVRVREVGSRESERMLLTWQRRAVSLTDNLISVEAQVFERLYDPEAEHIEYRFETDDDRTAWERVLFVDPPVIVSARAIIEPPEYATQSVAGSASVMDVQEFSLGDGTDERAIAPMTLAGSEIVLTLDLSKPAVFSPDDEAWVVETFGRGLQETQPVFQSSGPGRDQWTIRFVLRESLRIPVLLVDSYGIPSNTESSYRFQAAQDNPASVTLLEPDRDMDVLPTAVISVVAEGVDDVGLHSVWLTQQHMVLAGAPEASGPGGALRPRTDEPEEIARVVVPGRGVQQITKEIRFEELGVTPGDELWVQAFATDIYAAWAAELREPSQSLLRRFRVLSEEEFLERVQGELSVLRQAAISTDEHQLRAREMIEQQPPDTMSRREQAQVSDRVNQMLEQLRHLRGTVQQNQFEDETLRAMFEAAEGMLERAGQQSEEASQSIDELMTQEEQGIRPDDSQEREEALDAQRGVQQELEQLADLLDRGEDTWVQRRRLQNLVRAQQELREQTEQIGKETTGQQLDELSEEERSEIERIAEAQRELAEQTGNAIEQMQEALEQIREHDPVAAAGLEEALRASEQQDTQELQEQAAEQAEQNRTSRATSLQEQAEQSLQEMLDALEQTLDQRDEVLQRLLLSLIDSIESLIARQQSEAQALADEKIEGRDDAMIRLHTNTLGVQDQANAGGMELSAVASHLGRASDAQSRAIVALRIEPVDVARAQTAERDSLERLEEALRTAKQLEEEMEERIADRKRKELQEAYREALRLQIELHSVTEPFADVAELSRRDRLDLRRMGDQQDEIGELLEELHAEIEDIRDAAVFEYAHNKLEEAIDKASSALQGALPVEAAAQQRRVIGLLRGLVKAMEEQKQDEDDFRENAGGGGGGGSGSQEEQVIPPIAELKLLRALQEDVYTRTRTLDESSDAPDEATIVELGESQQDLAEIGLGLIEKMEKDQMEAPALTPDAESEDDSNEGGEGNDQ